MRRTAKLFMHGGSQAVRLPKEFRFEGTEVAIRKEGASVVIERLEPDTPEARVARLDALFKRIDELRAGETFMPEGREQPPMPHDSRFDD